MQVLLGTAMHAVASPSDAAGWRGAATCADVGTADRHAGEPSLVGSGFKVLAHLLRITRYHGPSTIAHIRISDGARFKFAEVCGVDAGKINRAQAGHLVRAD